VSNHRASTWNGVVRVLQNYTPRTICRVEKGLLPHPRAVGMKLSIGMPEGQSADYRLLLPRNEGLHVKDFGTHYEAHIDEVHPDVNAIEHLRRDAPGAFIASGVALGAMIGKRVGTTKDAALAGAALGGLFAALLVSARED
jgi:hypothetical protein